MKKIILLGLFSAFAYPDALIDGIKKHKIQCGKGVANSCNKIEQIRSLLESGSCESGNARACEQMGDKYYMGDGVQISLDKALVFYAQACAKGAACSKLNATQKAKERIDNIVKNATTKPKALGDYQNGRGNEVLYIGETRYIPSCHHSDEHLAYDYGLGFLRIGNAKKAQECFKVSCERKYPNAKACTKLGLMHFSGDGAEFSYDEALKYFKLGCEAGDVQGCQGTKLVYDAKQSEKDKNHYEISIKK